MGQTLTNGIYLPAEGERNCYEGLAANWTALDGLIGGYNAHIGNTTIHVTAEDKQAWNGKADASALTAHTGDATIHVTAEDKQAWNGKADASALTAHTGDATIHVTAADKQTWNGKADASALTAHTGDTTIHVTAADKQTWDTVTNKANDADVMHLTGNETVSGQKTFSHVQTGVGRDLYHFASSPYSKNTPPVNISFQYIWFIGNSASQGITNNWYGGYIEHRVYPNGSAQGRWFVRDTSESGLGIELFINGNDKQFRPQGNNITDLGTPTNKWKSFNGINPGALSLPDLTAGVDISGYITAGNNHNEYTPTVDGWISVALKSKSGACALWIYQNDLFNGYYGSTARPGETEPFAATCLPVKANTVVNIDTKGSNSYVYAAKFYPCTGNV